jgi:hypothetical protein
MCSRESIRSKKHLQKATLKQKKESFLPNEPRAKTKPFEHISDFARVVGERSY